MTVYVLEGCGGLWEEDSLRRAVADGRFKYHPLPKYHSAEEVAGEIEGALGYVAICEPPNPPGDPREPRHILEGPFAKPYRSLVKGDFWYWLALTGEAVPVDRLFPHPAPPPRQRDWDED